MLRFCQFGLLLSFRALFVVVFLALSLLLVFIVVYFCLCQVLSVFCLFFSSFLLGGIDVCDWRQATLPTRPVPHPPPNSPPPHPWPLASHLFFLQFSPLQHYFQFVFQSASLFFSSQLSFGGWGFCFSQSYIYIYLPHSIVLPSLLIFPLLFNFIYILALRKP